MSSSNFNSSFLEQRNVPNEWKDAATFLNWYLPQAATLLNNRVIGSYSNQETPSGKQFISAATNTNGIDVFRKDVDFGTLPNTGTKSVAHGITVDDSFRIFNLYLAASNPTGHTYFCLQTNSLTMDSTNINFTSSSDLTAYTSCFVVIEYMRII